jgi:RNA polymerase sigma-70 factor (ECF subfamily)
LEDRVQGEASDAALVEGLAHGEVAALSTLYDRYAGEVYAFAAHALGRGPAEEVAQDVFVRVWQRASQFDSARGSVAAWIMGITRYRVVDELRQHGRRVAAADAIDELLTGVEDPGADVEEMAWAGARRRLVLSAIRELPEEQRRVILLAFFCGLTQSEIAEELGCPLGTVKTRIRLAVRKLRASLREQPLVQVIETRVSEQ